MKILYAIQGTGNGHLARAMEILPILRQTAETDILISGNQGDIQLPFPVKYRFYGVSFIFGLRGGVDFWHTFKSLKPLWFIRDLVQLPVQNYDVVISDFEPVSAWSCLLKRKKCIGLSHQNAVLHPDAPKTKKSNFFGKLILKYYAPAKPKYGFHFKAFDGFNFTPVIRPAIRNALPLSKNYYTVYLPSFSNHEIEKVLLKFPHIQWEVFSKHSKKTYQSGNVHFQPVSLEGFNKSFINCEGILCNAGFETPAEALFMGKKLCVIPMKNQYEQECNAAFLAEMGVMVLSGLGNNSQIHLNYWLESRERIHIHYPDNIREVLEMLLMKENYESKILLEI